MEDAQCIVSYEKDEASGFYKEFDDLKAYFLKSGAKHIELISVLDEHHLHFYK